MLGRVPAAGITTSPDSAFMAEVARNLIDDVDGFLRDKRFLILDRGTKFTAQFKRMLKDAGVAPVRISYQAPSVNAVAERRVKSVKRECLDHVILFGEAHRRRVLAEFAAHYNAERPHQGLNNELVSGRPSTGTGGVLEIERLGGLLGSYSRAA